jgi:hypothetical protein
MRFSRSTVSAGRSATDTATGRAATTCIARSLASSTNSGVRATKSVSQLSTTTAAFLPSKWT